MTVNIAEDRQREAVSATEESKVCVCGLRDKAGVRERGNERKGGRWRPQEKILKWVSMAEERERERDRERDDGREIEKERERERK